MTGGGRGATGGGTGTCGFWIITGSFKLVRLEKSPIIL